MIAWVCLVAFGAAPLLGSELREEGFSLRPPSGFRVGRMDFYRGTRVGAVEAGAPGRGLVTTLSDGETDASATILIALVGGSFQAAPSDRDPFSVAVARHFSADLGLALSVDRAEVVRGASPRVEVWGTVRQEGHVRSTLVAAIAGAGHHAVVTFSAPPARFAELTPAILASLETFRVDPLSSGGGWPTGVAGAAAGALAGALAISLALWRNRRRAAL